MTKAKRLCEAVQLTWDRNKFATSIVEARGVKRRLERTCPDAVRIDNRMFWRRAASERGNPARWLLPLLCFYWSVLDGTGSVERGLGKHAEYLVQSCGPQIEKQEVEGVGWSDLCLEIAEDLREEEQLFSKGVVGELLLTDFSRECAKLWVDSHGRRYGCYKTRKDKNVRRGPQVGTDRAVQAAQHAATDALLAQASFDKAADLHGRSTILDVSREQAAKDLRRAPRPLSVPKRIKNFRATTQRRLQEKRGAGPVWRGFVGEAPSLRLGGAMAVRHARSIETTIQAARATAIWTGALRKRHSQRNHGRGPWHGPPPPRPQPRRQRAARAEQVSPGAPMPREGKESQAPLVVIHDDGKRAPADANYKAVSWHSLHRAASISVPRVLDLQTRTRVDDNMLKVWLAIIACGKPVAAKEATAGSCSFAPSCMTTVAALHCTDRFKSKHRDLTKACATVAKLPGSQWTLVDSPTPKAHTIDKLDDFRDFLMRFRRFKKGATGGTYARDLQEQSRSKGDSLKLRTLQHTTLGSWPDRRRVVPR